ncbi:MAG: ATPase, partial [Bryobacterales bacterium]|nr:ATPase [Bryobacterales bacterium]
SSEHLLELINDVLAISKIEAGKIQFVQQPFDLGHLLHDGAEMIRVRTRQKGLQLIVDIAPGMPAAVLGDESKVRQVLLNLLGNAVKFTAEGGIGLHVRWHEDHATLEITDTGHGIAPEEMDKLFKPFAQTESGRMASEGTGLGLAISHNFITRMGGAIRVSSSLGQGTVFT